MGLKKLLVVFLVTMVAAGGVVAQQTAVHQTTAGDKVYLRVDGLSLRSNLDTLFSNIAGLGDEIENLSWSDVLENGTTPGTDVDFFGYDATGLGQVTTTGTFTGDSLVLNKDAAITGRLNVSSVTTLGDSLLVAGTVVLNDSLRVVSAVSMGSRLHVTGVTALGDSLHVVGNVDLDALFSVDGAATFGSTVTVVGETTLNDTLHVDAAALLSDSIYVGGNARLAGTVQADGATSLGSTLSVAGATTMSSALGVAGKTTLADSLIANAGADFNSTLNVDGNTTLNGTTIDGNLDLNGNGDVSGTFDVTGAAALSAALDVSGVTTLSDTLHAEAPAMLDDSLRVGGNTRLTQDLWVDGNTNIGGTVNITGATTLGGALSVSGVTSLGDSLHVSGGADFDGNVNVDGGTTTNTLSVTNTATFSGPSTFNDAATFGDSLYVNAPATFSDTAVFTGGAHITGGLNLDALTLNGVEIPALDDTDALPEGDSNLYFTAAREAALQAQLDQIDSLNQALTAIIDNLIGQLYDPPTATTVDLTAPTVTSGTITANFTDGGAEVELAGFIFSTEADLSDSTVYEVTPGANLSQALSGLDKGTTYYYRAFVETIAGRAEGQIESFTTIDDPAVTTSAVTDAAQSTATLGGTVTDDGGGTVSATGFYYSTAANLAGASSVPGSAQSGAFTNALTGLAQNTTYYYTAFVTNEAGTAKGDTLSFATVGPCSGATTLNYNGYTYPLVEVGDQCWFAENLRTTKLSDGVTDITDAEDTVADRFVWQAANNNEEPATGYSGSTLSARGRNYNWYAVEAGLCPTDWRVPTDADWSEVIAAVGTNSNAGAYLKAASWSGSSNAVGLDLLPGGLRYNAGGYGLVGQSGFYWSSTQSSIPTEAWYRGFVSENNGVTRVSENKSGGFSVRCVKG